MTVKINNAFIRRIDQEKPEKVREFRDTNLRGFLVRQQLSGFISYYAVTSKGSARRGSRRQRKVRIGEHPALAPSEARKAAEELIAKARLDALPIEKEVERWQLKIFLTEQYYPWATQHLKDPVAQKDQLRRFAKWGNLYIDEINLHLIENWRNKRLASGTSPSTINRNISAIGSVLSRALDWGFLKQHPLEGLKKLKVDRGAEPRMLTDDERLKLFDALETRDQLLREERERANQWRQERGYDLLPSLPDYGDHLTPIVLTAYYTGMRRGEIFSLMWGDIEMDSATLVVRAENAKTSQTRKIPVNEKLAEVIQNWREQNSNESGYVFPGKFGARLDNIQKSWNGLRKNYGLQRVRFKDLRSDFGSRLANNGVDLAVTQRLLGHSSPVVTMRYYVSIQDQTMRDAVRASIV
jgi:integrase